MQFLSSEEKKVIKLSITSCKWKELVGFVVDQRNVQISV